MALHIREAREQDTEAILSIIRPVLRDATTYALDPDMSDEAALAYWTTPTKQTFVAEDGDNILGTYTLAPNQAGGGSHVCNCGFIVSTAASGRGVARAMCEHALSAAREAGYRAMQFNFVVSTNTRAVRLWERMGFDIVGRLPRAFNHPNEGLVDALVMYQEL